MFNLNRSFNLRPSMRKYLKDHNYNMLELTNQNIDYFYNMQYPSKRDQIDRFQECFEEVTHFTDNFTTL